MRRANKIVTGATFNRIPLEHDFFIFIFEHLDNNIFSLPKCSNSSTQFRILHTTSFKLEPLTGWHAQYIDISLSTPIS